MDGKPWSPACTAKKPVCAKSRYAILAYGQLAGWVRAQLELYWHMEPGHGLAAALVSYEPRPSPSFSPNEILADYAIKYWHIMAY